MKKKVVSIMMTAALAVGMLAGCGNSDSGSSNAASGNDSKSTSEAGSTSASASNAAEEEEITTTLTVWSPSEDQASDSGEWLQTMCNQFAEEHPSWHITFDYGVCAESDAKDTVTQEGVRDVYNQECTKKLYLENQIEQVFHAFGYQDIETPTFEFFDVFGREVGTTPSRELYKFFDRDGNTLVLRPDFTPSIARAASMYFMEETMPIRLCYRGSSFVNSSSYQGRLKESTQMGVELLNDDSAMADAEIIAMTVKVMLDAGLTDFQISIGHVGFFQALSEEAALAEDVLNELKELISIKNHFGAEELLAKQNLRSDLFEALRDVPQLFGNAEILEKAKGLTRNPAAREALDRLATISHSENVLSDRQ